MSPSPAATAAATAAAAPDQAPDHPYGTLAPLDEHNQRLLANVHPPTWRNPTPQGRYNLVVIGGGSAGLVAAVGAAGLGAKVALVERHLLGGDCLNVGCVPSKSILRAAKVLGEMARAAEFGISLPGPAAVDFGAVMARMRRVRAEISDHDSAHRFTNLGVDVYLGEGHFTGPQQFQVGDQTLDFSKAIIATGSRPAQPPIPGLADAGYLTNETLFELTELPLRLAVIGGGPIGVEMAQAFGRFGSQVTLLEMGPRLLGRDDADAGALVQTVLTREGIHVLTGVKIEQVAHSGSARVLHYRQGDQAATLAVDAILVAAGRAPNLETLNLAAANVAAHAQGVQVDDTLQSSNPAIFAAGDIAVPYRFTHTADATARIALQNALFPFAKKRASSLVIPWCTYSDPEIAHVGLTPDQIAAQGIAVDTYIQAIGATDRGRADGDAEGFVKLHVRKGSDRIVGGTIVARHAGEMISEVTLAMVSGRGLKTLGGVIHPYPTQAEAIRKTADAYNRTRLTPLVQRLFGWWLARSR